jgi:hypothetical protein
MLSTRGVALLVLVFVPALLMAPHLRADTVLFTDTTGVASETIPAYYFDFSNCSPSCQPFEGYPYTAVSNTIPATVYVGDPTGYVSDKITTTLSPPGPDTWSCNGRNPCPGVTGVNFSFTPGLDLTGSPITCASIGGCVLAYDGSLQDLGAITWGPGLFSPGAGYATTLEFQSPLATLIDFQGGSSSLPTLLPSGQPVAEVTGTIGGFAEEDYYLFAWDGGAFSATGTIVGAISGGTSYLFSEGAAGSCTSGAAVMLDGGNSFTNTIAIGNLAPGRYCIGIDGTAPADPGFTLKFNTPLDGPTPEPVTLASLVLGLGLIGALRLAGRRRKLG